MAGGLIRSNCRKQGGQTKTENSGVYGYNLVTYFIKERIHRHTKNHIKKWLKHNVTKGALHQRRSTLNPGQI